MLQKKIHESMKMIMNVSSIPFVSVLCCGEFGSFKVSPEIWISNVLRYYGNFKLESWNKDRNVSNNMFFCMTNNKNVNLIIMFKGVLLSILKQPWTVRLFLNRIQHSTFNHLFKRKYMLQVYCYNATVLIMYHIKLF